MKGVGVLNTIIKFVIAGGNENPVPISPGLNLLPKTIPYGQLSGTLHVVREVRPFEKVAGHGIKGIGLAPEEIGKHFRGISDARSVRCRKKPTVEVILVDDRHLVGGPGVRGERKKKQKEKKVRHPFHEEVLPRFMGFCSIEARQAYISGYRQSLKRGRGGLTGIQEVSYLFRPDCSSFPRKGWPRGDRTRLWP